MNSKSKAEDKTKKPMQFSKKVCLFAMFVVMFALIENGILAWFDKQTLSDVAIAVIGTFGGFVTTGYFALSGIRDISLNKHGICVDDENMDKYYIEHPNEINEGIISEELYSQEEKYD